MGGTVVIVDDHAAFRSAARALLQAEGFDVVGEAADGTNAIAVVAEVRPDVVLIDVHLPDLDGFALAHRLVEEGAAATIVLTSSRSVTSFRRRLAANPEWVFIPKSELSGEALAAAVG